MLLLSSLIPPLGPLILTHTYLLLGCAIPLLLLEDSASPVLLLSGTLPLLSSLLLISPLGTLLLGVGDSFASIVGSAYGSIFFLSSSRKSFEGSFAAYLSLRLAYSLILSLPFFFLSNLFTPTSTSFFSSFSSYFSSSAPSPSLGFELATVLAVLLEAVLTQIDNFILPLFYLALLLIMGAH